MSIPNFPNEMYINRPTGGYGNGIPPSIFNLASFELLWPDAIQKKPIYIIENDLHINPRLSRRTVIFKTGVTNCYLDKGVTPGDFFEFQNTTQRQITITAQNDSDTAQVIAHPGELSVIRWNGSIWEYSRYDIYTISAYANEYIDSLLGWDDELGESISDAMNQLSMDIATMQAGLNALKNTTTGIPKTVQNLSGVSTAAVAESIDDMKTDISSAKGRKNTAAGKVTSSKNYAEETVDVIAEIAENINQIPVANGIITPWNMTSDALPVPYRTKSRSNWSTTYDAWCCFTAENRFVAGGAGTIPKDSDVPTDGEWWTQIDLGEQRYANRVMLKTSENNIGRIWPKTFQILGSNDDTAWDDNITSDKWIVVGSIEDYGTQPSTNYTWASRVALNHPGYFRYYRIKITKGAWVATNDNNDHFTIGQIQLSTEDGLSITDGNDPVYREASARNLKDVLGVSTVAEVFAKLRERCNGTDIPDFSNLRIGDYIDLDSLGAVQWNETYKNLRIVIAGFNTYHNSGDTQNTKNHIMMMFRNCVEERVMNSSNTVTGGFNSMTLKTYLNNDFKTNLKAATGGIDYVYPIKLCVSCKGGYGWVTEQIYVPAEIEIFGTPYWSDEGCYLASDTATTSAARVGYITRVQFPIFKNSYDYRIKTFNGVREYWWTSSVAGAAKAPETGSYINGFSLVAPSGYPYIDNAGTIAAGAGGVSPCFALA